MIGLGAGVIERLLLHLALGDVAHDRNHLGLGGVARRARAAGIASRPR